MCNSAKILLLGKTGVGKSSFINYFLGKTVAEAGVGKPVTAEYFIPYEIEDGRYPILIFDTKGLESKGANGQLDEIIREIRRRNNSDDILNWFHTIFYVVSMDNPRFEDFEAMFINKLQKEISQHIHIIITHCDSCKAESISNMKRLIAEKLGSMDNVEIFEVVCVRKKKRNGQIVEPHGKEIISERVFELLIKDMAYKLSFDYADTLLNAWYQVIDDTFTRLNIAALELVDKIVNLGGLIDTVNDVVNDTNRMNERFDKSFEEVSSRIFYKFDEKIELIQNQTDERFKKIFYPVAQLYASYRDTVMDSYIEGAGLTFDNATDWLDTEWVNNIDDVLLCAKLLPQTSQYLDADGEFPDIENMSLLKKLSTMGSVVGAMIGDIFFLKINVIKSLEEARQKLKYESIPSRDEIQAKTYKQIVEYFDPNIPLGI